MPTTPFRYTLLRLARRTSVVDGAWFPTGGRTDWTFQLDVDRLEDGGAVQVILEAAPERREASARELHDFTSLAEAGTTEANPTVTTRDRWVRARVVANTGAYWVQVLGWSAFFRIDPVTENDDRDRLPKEVREWSELERVVREAEDVVQGVLRPNGVGRLVADVNDPRFPGAVKLQIARQAYHIYRRETLGQRTGDGSAQVTSRQMHRLVDGLRAALSEFMPAATMVWRGR